jgi:hypothetical protein
MQLIQLGYGDLKENSTCTPLDTSNQKKVTQQS